MLRLVKYGKLINFKDELYIIIYGYLKKKLYILWSLKWISHEYFIKWTKYPFKKGYDMPRCGIMVIKPYVIWFGYAILKALYAYIMP
jgi:hypothetical protein